MDLNEKKKVRREKIGQRLLKALQPRERPYEVYDPELKGFLIRVQPNGASNYYCVYFLAGRRRRKLIGPSTVLSPMQARDEALKILADAKRGIDPQALREKEREPTVGDFLKLKYTPFVEGHHKTGTLTTRRIVSQFSNLFDRKLGDARIPWLVEQWKKQRASEGTEKTTINRDLAAIKGMFSQAVRWKQETGLTENPLLGVKSFRLTEGEGERVRFLDESEESILFAALDSREEAMRLGRERGNRWRRDRNREEYNDLRAYAYADYLKPMVELSLHTGLRRGEIFRIEWADVQWDTKSLVVRGAIAKNGRSRRIPINKIAFKILQDWQNQSNQNAVFVFPGKDNKPFNNIHKSWNSVLRSAAIADFHWHDLRHTFASRLVMRGVPLNTVRELLGHRDIKMTLRYAHLAPEITANAVATLEKNPKVAVNG